MGITGSASILGEIHNIREGTSLRVPIIMDQGNLISPGVGMSKGFFQCMNMVYADRARDHVKTASVESILTRLGLSECFILKLEGFMLQFGCQAAVIRGLSTEVNMGSGF